MNKKIIKTLSFVFVALLLMGVLAVSSVFIINNRVKTEYSDRILSVGQADELKDVDCILVLGCKVHEDGSLSDLLNDRIYMAREVYKTGVSKKVLMSGDHGRVGYNEVQSMKNYFLVDNLTSEENIFMDHAGFSTYESMYRARDVFNVKKVLIVTSTYHIYRAVYIAQKLGLDAYGVGIDDNYTGRDMRELREILARNKDFFKCIFKPKPTYLGDVIDIHGDGRQTND